MICKCGRHISMTFVNLFDYCPGCGSSPVVEKGARDPEHEKVHAGRSHGCELRQRCLHNGAKYCSCQESPDSETGGSA